MLTVEELLMPRYKVIADYFYNPYKVGDIITVMYEDRSVHLTTTRFRDEFGEMVAQHNYFHPGELKNFPTCSSHYPGGVRGSREICPNI